jgi:hypothetical protein
MPSKAIASLDAWLARAEEVLAEQRENAISPSLGLSQGGGNYEWTTLVLSGLKVTHVRPDLPADVRHMEMDLIEKVRVLLHCLCQGGVLGNQFLDVIGVVRRVNSHLRRDGIRSLGGNQKSGSLNACEHREEEVQQNVGIRIESLVMKDVLEEKGIDQRPDDHDGEEGENEGPRSHYVSHPVG